MNERIKQLAEHCDFYVGNEHYDKPREEQQRLFMEKFAELIVQECIREIGYKSVELLDIDFYPHYQERLKNYFGVEE